VRQFVVTKGGEFPFLEDVAVLILSDLETKEELSILIGKAEYQSIVIGITNLELPRPLTHDLALFIIEGLWGGELFRVVLDDVENGIYFAKLYVKKGKAISVIDVRPSDAIALAVRRDIPIFVEEAVIEKVEKEKISSGLNECSLKPLSIKEAEEIKKKIKDVKPEDFFKRNE